MNQETADTPMEEKPGPTFEWTRLKIITFSIAGLLIAAGVVLAVAGTGGGGPDETLNAAGPMGAEPTGAGAQGLLPGSMPGSTGGGTTGPDAADPAPTVDEGGGVSWSPALIRGGISFFAAFALAFAFRSFLKVALIIAGVWAGAMFYLSYVGWIEVHWDVIDAAFKSVTANIGDQFQSAQTFITGSLPSTGMAGLGLFTGFKRK